MEVGINRIISSASRFRFLFDSDDDSGDEEEGSVILLPFVVMASLVDPIQGCAIRYIVYRFIGLSAPFSDKNYRLSLS